MYTFYLILEMDEQRQFSGDVCPQEKLLYENCIRLKLFEYHCILEKHAFLTCFQEKEKRLEFKNKIESKSTLPQ
jgi:hypothetical protein